LNIIVASDHVGVSLKQVVIGHLASLGINTTDAGVDEPDVSVDYPDYAKLVGQGVSGGDYDRGVLVCGTGQGMFIAANRMPGIRAALCHDVFTARQSREHNDANVLCLGAKVVTPEQTTAILEEWINTQFLGGIHLPRLAKLDGELSSKSAAKKLREGPADPTPFRFGIALSPRPTVFGPLLYAGKLQEGIRAAAEAGFNAIELSLRSADDIQPDFLNAILEEHGLVLSAIATGQACYEDDLCLSNPDPKVHKAVVNHLKSMLRLAALFKASVILGGIRGRLTGTAEQRADQRAAAVRAICECAHFAQDLGVQLLIEPINRYETNFVNTASQGLDLAEEVEEKNVKLLLDLFHMNIEEVDLTATIMEAGNMLGYVHFADSNRLAPGQGHTDFNRVLQTLRHIGYGGIITFEILPLPDDAEAMRQAGKFIKELRNYSLTGELRRGLAGA
jgi:RpiB/LacA/LacB family sugar-phosphate isomerase